MEPREMQNVREFSDIKAQDSKDIDSTEIKSARDLHGVKWFLVCIGLYSSGLIYGLDSTIAADIQASIVETFGNVDQLTWIGTGFPMGSVCAILPAAAFYAVFDLKILFISSVVLFEVGSVLCGAAPSMNALIVGRVIAGIGGSGVYIGILNYVSVSTTDQERGKYISAIGMVWGVGAILGPVVGGAFSTSSATWRWSFYINLVIAAICAPIYIFYLPSVKPPAAAKINVAKLLFQMDWAGFTLSSGALVSFCVALTFAGSLWAWNDARTVALLVVCGVLLVITYIQQHCVLFTTAESRMMPPSYLVRDRSQLLLGIQTAATCSNVYIPLYYIPLYFQFVHGDTASKAAVRLLPFILLMITANMTAGICLPKIGYYWMLYLGTGIFMTVGAALMYTINITSPAANVYGYSILLAIGSGATFQVGYSVAGVKAFLRNENAQDVQSAVSLQNIYQVGGMLLSLLISGQIFQSTAFANLKVALVDQAFSDAQIRSLVAGTQSSLFDGLSEQVAVVATTAITAAISRVYILSIALGALSLVASLFLKKERLFVAAAVAGG